MKCLGRSVCLCVCVFGWLGCWLEIRPPVCLRARETVCVSPSSLILTHLPPPPPLHHPTTHTHTHMQQGLTPSCTISMGELRRHTHTLTLLHTYTGLTLVCPFPWMILSLALLVTALTARVAMATGASECKIGKST